MSTEVLRNVPASQVDDLVAQFKAIGATVTTERESDGEFNVTAVFDGHPHLSPMATDTAEEAAAPLPAQADGPLPAIRPSKRFDELATEYLAWFDRCQVRPEQRNAVTLQVQRLQTKSASYKALGEALGIPWFFIGIIHMLEANMNFSGHLHNGDPLTARTVRVPAGRPLAGTPPFRWEESARDALQMKGFVGQADWSVARMLHRWEGYNGFGYRLKGLATPYLWSFSPLYEKGRFVRDHVFDPEAVSKQCGAAVLLKALQAQQLV